MYMSLNNYTILSTPKDTCTICLEPYIYSDLNLLLSCGHQFHYVCANKVKNKKECCICKKTVISTAKIIWKEHIDMYNPLPKGTLFKCVLNTSIYANIINKRLLAIQEAKNIEIRNTIETYIKQNISLIHTQILSACNRNETSALVCGHEYGYNFEGFPFVFLVYGPRYKGLEYFEQNNIRGLSDVIQDTLGKEFECFPYRKNKKNYILVSWKLTLLKRY